VHRLLRWYGANPLHLLALLGSFALAGYAAAQLLPMDVFGIAVWFAGAVIGHDLLLMPLYTLADRSAAAVFRHIPQKLPTVQWINYLRVPVVLSGLLLLIWFPLIFRLPTGFPAATTLSLDPYLWHWLAVTGALFLLSATALALRLRAGRSGTGKGSDGHGALALKGVDPLTPSDPSAFAREQAELAASEPAGIAPVGTVLPDAELLDVHGAATTLSAAAGDGMSVLVFYRGAWCPYCNIALPVYQDQLLPELTERGIRLVAISPQKPDGSLTMQQKHALAFTVVSDPGNIIAARLGILTQPSDEARAAQLQLGLDLTSVNADGTVALPMPATVILDASRTVRWVDVHPDYSTRTEPRQVIDALDQLGH
jgi:peroxiredoxin